MCGRLAINGSISTMVSDKFNIGFSSHENANLCPSETVATIIKPPSGYQQLNTQWGIKPTWSNRLLINAQAETVSSKPTFRQSFLYRRCLVPCSAWYEWRLENNKKVKYTFNQQQMKPSYMAGIWYDNEQTQLVTLTTTPNEKCAAYHKRMPVIILEDDIDLWFEASPDALSPLLTAVNNNTIEIHAT